MKEMISGIVIALLGSGLIQFLITRADNKKEKPLEKKLDSFIKDQSEKLNKIINEYLDRDPLFVKDDPRLGKVTQIVLK